MQRVPSSLNQLLAQFIPTAFSSSLRSLSKNRHFTHGAVLSVNPYSRQCRGRPGVLLVPLLSQRGTFRLMRLMLLTLFLLASLPTFPQAADSSQPEGTISGTVLDEHGQPFKGVRVCTYMIGAPSGSKEARGDCPATTDEVGEFRIDHVAMGTFGVEAIKPEDGYVAFAGTSVKKMVTLTLSQSSATVALKLGPKPGVLLPSVKDKLTGEPIISFQVSWEISDSPQGSHSGGQTITQGIKRAIVPP